MDKDTSYYTKIIAKIVILILMLVGIFLTYKLAMFYIPFIIAMIIAALVEPIIKFFMKHVKMKRKVASIVSLILVVVIISLIIFFSAFKIISEATNLLSNMNIYFDDVYKWISNIIEDIEEGRIALPEQVTQVLQNSLTGIVDVVKNILVNFFTGLVNIVSSVPTMVTNIFITILAIIFICFDREYIPNAIKSQIPTKWFKKIKEIIQEVCSVSLRYIKAEAKLSCICFALVLIGLNVINIIGIKIDYLFIMAIFIGFIDILPLFGAGAVMIPWSIYLLLVGNIPLAISIIILWLIWAIIRPILEPKMVSKEMGIHPIFTLVGMYTGFKLAGVLGLIVGPIVLLILKNIFKELINKGILKSFFELE